MRPYQFIGKSMMKSSFIRMTNYRQNNLKQQAAVRKPHIGSKDSRYMEVKKKKLCKIKKLKILFIK